MKSRCRSIPLWHLGCVAVFAPPDLSGVKHFFPTYFSEDFKSHVYYWQRYTSKLFITGVVR
ncbi:MAG: hypothetical protein JSR52_01325 [Planctomycetes bacterium]|nr:hypothetical protein [Planctomycetota bacterium]